MNALRVQQDAAHALGFVDDVRAMCGLIDEAGRYGTTPTTENEYRRLRARMSAGYRSLDGDVRRALEGVGGFHGCGFEMILGNYSLDNLARGPGKRCVDRLDEVWRRVHALATSAP